MIPLTTIGPVALEVQSVTFGFCNEPDSFEPLMERVLAGVPQSCCIVYLDDILVHIADFESTRANLPEVFQAIHRAGLHLHPEEVSSAPVFRHDKLNMSYSLLVSNYQTPLKHRFLFV